MIESVLGWVSIICTAGGLLIISHSTYALLHRHMPCALHAHTVHSMRTHTMHSMRARKFSFSMCAR